MPHDWLKDSWPTDAMPRDQLQDRIERLLNMQNMGVLATTSKYGNPVATPIEFYPEGLNLYMYPQPGSPKIANLQRNPKTCIAVHAPYCGWSSARGAQVFGTAELIEKGQPGHEHGLDVFRWESSAAELQRPMDKPPEGIVLKITATKIVYTEHWLRRDGFAPRQYWLASEG